MLLRITPGQVAAKCPLFFTLRQEGTPRGHPHTQHAQAPARTQKQSTCVLKQMLKTTRKTFAKMPPLESPPTGLFVPSATP